MAPYDEKLDRLLGAAAKVFARKGYHPTTMRDLARATGMSLAGIYHYVSGKDELLYLIQHRSLGAVLDGAKQITNSTSTDGQSQLAKFIEHHITFFASHMSEMKVLSHDVESLDGERFANIQVLKKEYVDLLTSVIQKTDPEANIDPNVATYALFGMMNWIYTWYDPKGSVSPEKLANDFTRLFLEGLTCSTHPALSAGGR